MNLESITEKLEHPVSLVTGLVSSIGVGLDPSLVVGILTAVWQSAGTIFTAASITSFTVAPNVPALGPFTDILQTLAIAAALLFLVKLANRAYDNFEDTL